MNMNTFSFALFGWSCFAIQLYFHNLNISFYWTGCLGKMTLFIKGATKRFIDYDFVYCDVFWIFLTRRNLCCHFNVMNGAITDNEYIVIELMKCKLKVNCFSFSGDEEMPTNLGLLDQRQVLLWVQENIAGKTWRPLGRGQDAESKFSKSAFIPQPLRIFLKDSAHCLYPFRIDS